MMCAPHPPCSRAGNRADDASDTLRKRESTMTMNQLEAEGIDIIREAVATARKPVKHC